MWTLRNSEVPSEPAQTPPSDTRGQHPRGGPACDDDKAKPSPDPEGSTDASTRPASVKASSTTADDGPSPSAESSAATSATPAASTSATTEADDGEDCTSLCKRFSKRRAECVDVWVKNIKLPAPAIEKVKANHQKNADGGECEFLCETPKTVEAWGRCAKSERTCEDFHACFKEANK